MLSSGHRATLLSPRSAEGSFPIAGMESQDARDTEKSAAKSQTMNNDRRYAIDPDTGCWIWQGARTTAGYGSVGIDGKVKYAHRLSYQLHKGGIQRHLQVDHLCGNRACVNPDHLELVTHAENGRRGRRAKLTHEAVAEIREAPRSITNRALGERFGVTEWTVSVARRGLSWS